MGFGFWRSTSASSMAACWSGVSSNGKVASNSSSNESRGEKAKPGVSSRAACTESNCCAMLRNAALDAALGLLPGLSPKPIDARCMSVGARVALDPIEAVHRHEEPCLVRVLQAQELFLDAAQLELDEPAVDADAVVRVHQVITGLEVRQGFDGGPLGPPPAHLALLPRAKDLFFANDGEPLEPEAVALRDLQQADLDAPAPGPARLGAGGVADARGDAVLREQVTQAFGVGARAAGEQRAPTRALPVRQAIHQGRQRLVVTARAQELPAQLVVVAGRHFDDFPAIREAIRHQMLQGDRVARAHRLEQRFGAECQAIRRCDHAVILERQLEILEQLLGVAQQPRTTGMGVVDDDQRVLWQEVEDRLLARLQQRSQRFDSRWQMAAQQCVEQLPPRRPTSRLNEAGNGVSVLLSLGASAPRHRRPSGSAMPVPLLPGDLRGAARSRHRCAGRSCSGRSCSRCACSRGSWAGRFGCRASRGAGGARLPGRSRSRIPRPGRTRAPSRRHSEAPFPAVTGAPAPPDESHEFPSVAGSQTIEHGDIDLEKKEDPNRIIHIICPEGHELPTPMSMVGQDAMCPHCNVLFRLRYEDSKESKIEREEEAERREIAFGDSALRWAIVAAVVIGCGLVGLIVMMVYG